MPGASCPLWFGEGDRAFDSRSRAANLLATEHLVGGQPEAVLDIFRGGYRCGPITGKQSLRDVSVLIV